MTATDWWAIGGGTLAFAVAMWLHVKTWRATPPAFPPMTAEEEAAAREAFRREMRQAFGWLNPVSLAGLGLMVASVWLPKWQGLGAIFAGLLVVLACRIRADKRERGSEEALRPTVSDDQKADVQVELAALAVDVSSSATVGHGGGLRTMAHPVPEVRPHRDEGRRE